ncbi:MAG TPA: hypothetical protein VM914_09105 [Pyrinomonadaceae bacterium]|nr:hypothetical protein [Pyrinomonadaceae bacterium]
MSEVTALLLLHNVGMPPLGVCLIFLLLVLSLLGFVVRLMVRHGTADGARCAVVYLLMCLASFVLVAYDDRMAAQASAFTLTLPLSLLFADGGDAVDRIPALVFCSLANACAFVIFFGLYQSARRARRAAAAHET